MPCLSLGPSGKVTDLPKGFEIRGQFPLGVSRASLRLVKLGEPVVRGLHFRGQSHGRFKVHNRTFAISFDFQNPGEPCVCLRQPRLQFDSASEVLLRLGPVGSLSRDLPELVQRIRVGGLWLSLGKKFFFGVGPILFRASRGEKCFSS